MSSTQQPAPVRALRVFLWSGAAAALATLWIFYMHASAPGDHSFIGFVIAMLPFLWAALTVAFVPGFWVGQLALQRARRGRRSFALIALASLAAAAGVACTLFALQLAVGYFTPPYEGFKARREPSQDFTAPWGGRMLAVPYDSGEPPVSRRTIWVAETQLTRGEYSRMVGKAKAGDAALPVTGLTAAEIEEMVEGANRQAAASTAPPNGRFRLPTILEYSAYSGDWWINRYPKSIHRCASGLSDAASRPANGIGVRGTTDNAAEIVTVQYDPRRHAEHCATQGGVEPHCAREDGKKTAGIRYCSDRDAGKVFGDPLVGVRLVYSLPL